MAFGNSVIIVASPRPRVGKTLLARLLVDFHSHEDRSIVGFDLNPGDGALMRFLPEQTKPASIGDIQDQMALFDRLVADDDTAKVVDVGHQLFERFFTLASEIGFAEESRRPAILYLMTPDRTAIDAYVSLRDRFPNATLTPVYNEVFGPAYLPARYPLHSDDAQVMRLPALAPALRKYIETPPFSFADARLAAATTIPLDVHIELQRWLHRVYTEFRELDLRVLLAGLHSPSHLSSQ
jgi:hypothetical protein